MDSPYALAVIVGLATIAAVATDFSWRWWSLPPGWPRQVFAADRVSKDGPLVVGVVALLVVTLCAWAVHG